MFTGLCGDARVERGRDGCKYVMRVFLSFYPSTYVVLVMKSRSCNRRNSCEILIWKLRKKTSTLSFTCPLHRRSFMFYLSRWSAQSIKFSLSVMLQTFMSPCKRGHWTFVFGVSAASFMDRGCQEGRVTWQKNVQRWLFTYTLHEQWIHAWRATRHTLSQSTLCILNIKWKYSCALNFDLELHSRGATVTPIFHLFVVYWSTLTIAGTTEHDLIGIYHASYVY